MAIKHPLTSLTVLVCLNYCLAASIVPRSSCKDGTQSSNEILTRFDEFDWDLCKLVYSATYDNVLISPISLKIVLAILSEGAGGATAKEIDYALQVSSNKDKAALRKKLVDISNGLEQESHKKNFTLLMGTGAFIDDTIKPHPDFKKQLIESYKSSIAQVPFKQPELVANKVNSWAKGVTKGFIQKFLSSDDITSDEKFMMVNILFFKALWLKPFDPKRTETRSFHVNHASPVQTLFMNRHDEYKYLNATDIDAQIVKLPYIGGEFSMYIMLPNQINGLNDLVGKLSLEKLRDLHCRMTDTKVDVTIPKFSFDSHTFLKPFLQQLRVNEIFTDKANLSGIAEKTDHELYVSNILQRTGLEVEEAGSTAYVITEAHLANKFGDSYTEFFADRPFLFSIEHDLSKVPVFTGKITNPKRKFSEIESVTPPPTTASIVTEPQHSTTTSSSPAEPSQPANSMGVSAATIVPPTTEDASSMLTGLPEAGSGYASSNSAPVPDAYMPHGSAEEMAPGDKEPEVLNTPKPIVSPDSPLKFLQDSNFDTKLLHGIFSSKPDENIIVSPVSVKMALALLLEGAGPNTASELAKAIGLPRSVAQLRDQLGNFQRSLQRENSNVKVTAANGFFISKSLAIAPDYKSKVTDKYQASVNSINFKDANRASLNVNEWVKKKTQGVVDNLIAPGDVNTDLKMLIVNTLYFKGKWDLGFSPKTTVLGCFTPSDGRCRKVHMMETNSIFNYAQVAALGAQVMELPYKDEKYSLILMLPHSHEKEAFKKLVQDLPAHQLQPILQSMRPKKVFVSLPRFTFSQTTNLVPLLQNLGVKEVFSKHSDLTGIIASGDDLAVDKIVQKAKIELDEHGTVSAAATGSSVIPLTSAVATFDADRPFLFFLRDRDTGAILFEGILSDPEAFSNSTQIMGANAESPIDSKIPILATSPPVRKPAPTLAPPNELIAYSPMFSNKTQQGISSITGQNNWNEVTNSVAPKIPQFVNNENISPPVNMSPNRPNYPGGPYGAPSVTRAPFTGETRTVESRTGEFSSTPYQPQFFPTNQSYPDAVSFLLNPTNPPIQQNPPSPSMNGQNRNAKTAPVRRILQHYY